jgi:restriction endonuclease S subunit
MTNAAEQKKLDKIHEIKLEIMSRLVHLFPEPRDENGKHIPFVMNKAGEIVEWPKDENGEYLSMDKWA